MPHRIKFPPHDGPCEWPDHAPATAYTRGCRCPRCRSAAADRVRRRHEPGWQRRSERAPHADAVQAGCERPALGRATAFRYGCRCAACLAWYEGHKAAMRKSLAARRARVAPEPAAPVEWLARFDERLRYAMRRRGMDVNKLAAALGVLRKTVRRWLRGCPPQSRFLAPLCRALNVKRKFFINEPGGAPGQEAHKAVAQAAGEAQ